MVFYSTVFLFIFLPLVLLVHFCLRFPPIQNIFLLIASLFFYAWGEPVLVLLLLGSIAFNYLLGGLIGRAREGKIRGKMLVAVALTGNLGLLAFYKYAHFFLDNLNGLYRLWAIPAVVISPIHLPIGLSFFTFKAISYIIDTYRQDTPVYRNPLQVGLYISFFPQILAGPIVRFKEMAPQLVRRALPLADFAQGMERMILGLGKKMILASAFGEKADLIFAIPSAQLTPDLAWLGAILYTLEIYFDFSGYSDMAIGISKMLGFTIPENFNYPYVATSIREFWKRWHITLSHWFRDYLYLPLGGNRRSRGRVYFNLLSVFFFCGLWHGASWNFIVWGLFHGTFLILERLGGENTLQKIWRPVRHLYALGVIMVGWVLFRSDSLTQALCHLKAMAGWATGDGLKHNLAFYLTGELLGFILVGMLLSTPLHPYLAAARKRLIEAQSRSRALALEIIFSMGVLLFLMSLFGASLMVMASRSYSPFIYFRF
jgi:alginate O-acetyltransferase complex protein AlgI